MVSINDVRETVLAICNKNNYGYISPDDFNLYAKQAQLDIFNGYMSKYNYYMNMQNQHQSGSDLASLAQSAREAIEMFISAAALTYNAPLGQFSTFNAPDNWYHINVISHEPQPVTNPNVLVEVQKSSRLDISRLLNSNLTAPSTTYPVYFIGQPSVATPNGTITIAPSSIQSDVSAVYVRYPVDPKWEWVFLSNGEPVQDVALTVDFEVAEDEESMLVDKILEKAGLSIREPEVYNTAKMNDNQQQ
jgi:hypothetical protein